jgi:hypothetical protein
MRSSCQPNKFRVARLCLTTFFDVILQNLFDFLCRRAAVSLGDTLDLALQLFRQTDKKTNAIFCGHFKTSLEKEKLASIRRHVGAKKNPP